MRRPAVEGDAEAGACSGVGAGGIGCDMLAPLWTSLLSLWFILWGLNLISRPSVNVLLYGGLAALLISVVTSLEEGDAPAPAKPEPGPIATAKISLLR